MKASNTIKLLTYSCLILALTGIAQFPAFGQEKEKKAKDGPTHIHIEKMENGKRKVLDKTYQSGEKIPEDFDKEPGWQEVPEDNIKSKVEFKFDGEAMKLNLDSTFRNFHFNFPQEIFSFHNGDTLFQHKFFDSENFEMKWQQDFQPQLDSLLNQSQEMIEQFKFNFGDAPSLQFESEQETYEFDKREYEIKETEDGKGHQKITITRRKPESKPTDIKGKENKKGEKSQKH